MLRGVGLWSIKGMCSDWVTHRGMVGHIGAAQQETDKPPSNIQPSTRLSDTNLGPVLQVSKTTRNTDNGMLNKTVCFFQTLLADGRTLERHADW